MATGPGCPQPKVHSTETTRLKAFKRNRIDSTPLALNAELPQDKVVNVGVGHRALYEHAALRTENHATLSLAGGRRAVRAFDERRIDRNALGCKVEMQLHRVIARLVVN